jgi:TFIIF-interacting CTD phosphatase-like protein
MNTNCNSQAINSNREVKEKHRNNKLCISVNAPSITRGVSVDNNKQTPKGISHLAFSKLVTQSSKESENGNNYSCNNLAPQMALEKEKIHSQSPLKKMAFENNILIPPQISSKMNKKTLVLDLDETLIHSGFHHFECGADIVLKVSVII